MGEAKGRPQACSAPATRGSTPPVPRFVMPPGATQRAHEEESKLSPYAPRFARGNAVYKSRTCRRGANHESSKGCADRRWGEHRDVYSRKSGGMKHKLGLARSPHASTYRGKVLIRRNSRLLYTCLHCIHTNRDATTCFSSAGCGESTQNCIRPYLVSLIFALK